MSASQAAEKLRQVLGDPIYNRTLRKEVGRGELDYEVYLRTRELFALQTPANELVVPDELVFQVMHQTQELWLKCAAFETANLVEQLDGEDLFQALATLDRIVLVMRSVADQIRILFTLSPSRFHVIRRSLGNGSGLESPGYNQVLAAADAAGTALERLIARRGATLADVYREPERHRDAHRLAERFVDWDSAFQGWLVEHFQLVRRTLGIDKTVRGLDGFPTIALGARMMRPLFAALWNVRVELAQGWRREGGFAPGAERPPVLAAEPVPPRDELADALRAARAEFPLLARCTYLNSNATGAAPRGAKAALDGYWKTIEGWRDEAWEGWWSSSASTPTSWPR